MLRIAMFSTLRAYKLNEIEEQINTWLKMNGDSITIENIEITTSNNSTIVLILYNILVDKGTHYE